MMGVLRPSGPKNGQNFIMEIRHEKSSYKAYDHLSCLFIYSRCCVIASYHCQIACGSRNKKCTLSERRTLSNGISRQGGTAGKPPRGSRQDLRPAYHGQSVVSAPQESYLPGSVIAEQIKGHRRGFFRRRVQRLCPPQLAKAGNLPQAAFVLT